MLQCLYNAASGLSSQQKNVDVIANNVANVGTDGYKKTRLDFQDCLYRQLRAPHPASNGPEKNLRGGTGAIEYQTARILLQGPLAATGRLLDFAIDGKGFFVLENPHADDPAYGEYDDDVDRSVLYTRAGSFFVSPEGDEDEQSYYLVDSLGRYLLDEDGQRIALTDGVVPQCSTDGVLTYYDEYGEATVLARLQIAYFTNPGGLANAGGGAYIATENCGEAAEPGTYVSYVLQGYTESSNVDLSEELTRLIRSQRVYQLASRCVSTADQMMGLANSIRR
ncbi:MAG: flagellar hook-basal body protein [Oscillospiraceae bacterium]|jgi:flagellar basal-body rod protein FlgG|nr:flagellar hook-basal body protein [Oscillospiraceae bacterium]